MNTGEPKPTSGGISQRAALAFALLFPTLLTWVYFIALDGSSPALQKSAYGIGKVIQFAFPLFFVLLIQRERLKFGSLNRRAVVLGAAFGIVVAAAMLGLYELVLQPRGFFSEAVLGEVRGKLTGFGIDSIPKYAALGVFYALVHSLLEEYYWRWFVFGRLRNEMPLWPAVAVSSVGFAAHHLLVLGKYFGWTSPATWLFVVGIAIGGAVWAFIYEKSRSLAGPWLSHLLVDAAIFLIGYDLVRDLLK